MKNHDSGQVQADYWEEIARRYAAIPGPLVPGSEDIALYKNSLQDRVQAGHALRVLVLGATPAFFNMDWPAGSDLLAVDRSSKVLQALWPGGEANSRSEDWNELSLAEASRDVALCDGGLSLIDYPQQLARFAQRLQRILKPGGIFVVRLYASDSRSLTLDQIVSGVRNRSIRNSSELKLCLWLALNEDSDKGVRLHDVWQCLFRIMPDFIELVTKLGWDSADAASMNGYRNLQDVYQFPTVEQLSQLFCHDSGEFDFVSQQIATYPFAEYAPIITLRRR